jgi:hypothetical protein
MAITLDGTSGITSPTLDSTGTTTISTNNVALRLKDSSGSLYEAIKATSSNQLQLSSGGASSSYLFYANAGTLKLRIDNDGLKFNSDTAAANALDDYEEGTFTPNIGGSGVSYGTQTGVYRKIGSLVYVYLQISINTYGSPATSNEILGLPFPPTISNQYFGIAYATGLDSNYYEIHGNFRSEGKIRIDGKQSNGSGQNSGISWAGNGAAIYGSGCYYTS